MKPVAVVTTHPIQYQTPLFRYLSARGIPLHVFFLCDRGIGRTHDPGFAREVSWDIPLLQGFDHEFLPNLRRDGQPERFAGLINPGIFTEINPERFSAIVVHGYRTASMLGAIFWSRVRRLPVLYRSESNFLTESPSTLKRSLGRMLEALVSAFLSIGTLNDRFYEEIGVPATKRFLVPYAVDNERFAQQASSMGQTDARQALGLPQDKLMVLFAGKLLPTKQPDMLLRAFAHSRQANTHLAIVGDGAMMEGLKRMADKLVPRRVSFLGFLNQSTIGVAYKSANLLVLPSLREPWGLVVNEAMNFSVPALVSDRVGCAPDLVQEGQTGSIFAHDDLGSLTERLKALLSDQKRLGTMGINAKRRVDTWNFDRCADGFRDSLKFVGAL